MRTVELYGWLGTKYGKSFDLEVKTAAEAVRALCANFPSFRSDVGQDGVVVSVIEGRRRDIGVDQLHEPLGSDTVLKIVPMPAGAKGAGVFQTILGVVLIVVGAILSIIPGFQGAGVFLMKVGLVMVISGVAQMLVGTPKAPKPGETEKESSNVASDLFNGPVNTSAQGNPVPLCYGGPILVGSYVVSAGYTTKDVGV